ncbi:hypothetical protein BU14_0502s0007 [Porphyra umbilicalis]|uniref:Condensin complex subunit 1 C-terminal domain-containing protein n=1 Tax=Porphyra umbilicalis TaxID=2786 RepID=A0A1X6NTR1_PORUM|nr:hypothetical protein BU14_0502s0007 [Porphyra umbilicalis]|eukprot:OSX71773.1 hypothetical protein BU14_0502s0007 [Porphyra umbilicalis]
MVEVATPFGITRRRRSALTADGGERMAPRNGVPASEAADLSTAAAAADVRSALAALRRLAHGRGRWAVDVVTTPGGVLDQEGVSAEVVRSQALFSLALLATEGRSGRWGGTAGDGGDGDGGGAGAAGAGAGAYTPADEAVVLAALRRALTVDASPTVRSSAAAALGHLADTDSAGQLMGVAVDDVDWLVRMSAAVALGTMGGAGAAAAGDVVGMLVSQLNGRDPSTVGGAALEVAALLSSLGQLGDARALPAVLRWVATKDDLVRLQVAEVLAAFPLTDEVRAALGVLLNDEGHGVAAAARMSLERGGGVWRLSEEDGGGGGDCFTCRGDACASTTAVVAPAIWPCPRTGAVRRPSCLVARVGLRAAV